VLALVSKTLLEVPPRVREIRPDVPPILDDLIARMLAKAPRDRPADGAQVLRELSTAEATRASWQAESAAAAAGPAPVISRSELQLVSVLLARLDEPAPRELAPTERGSAIERVRELARRYSARRSSSRMAPCS